MMCSPNPPEQFDILSYRLKIVDGKCADISRANIQLEMENERVAGAFGMSSGSGKWVGTIH